MTRGPSDEAVHAFWAWFASNAAVLAQSFENQAILDEIDARVSMWNVYWEVGPGASQPCAFALSPGRDSAMLEVTRKIIALAPAIDGWELHPALPPKQWTLQFKLKHYDDFIEIDAREWRYVLYLYKDDMFGITLFAPTLGDVDESLHEMAAWILLDGMLGEERRISTIVDLEVELAIPEDKKSKASSIAVLAKHLDQLAMSR